jgi:hypothetical protein
MFQTESSMNNQVLKEKIISEEMHNTIGEKQQ